jgi:hypothetical protein
MTDGNSPMARSYPESERSAFLKAYPHLDLTEMPDAWGRPMFKHTHVQALWAGWFARATLHDLAQTVQEPSAIFEECAKVADLWAKSEDDPAEGDWLRGHRYGKEQAGKQIASAIRRMSSVTSTHVCTLEEAATRLNNELTGQNIQREMFSIGIGANALHVYTQLARVNCRADRIGGWDVVWHFNVGPAVALSSTDGESQ